MYGDDIHSDFWGFDDQGDSVDDDVYGPTTAQPGSYLKVSAMARRYEAGIPLWHPGDQKSIRSLKYEDQMKEKDAGKD